MFALPEIDLRQLMLIHQFHEPTDFADVEHVAWISARTGHECLRRHGTRLLKQARMLSTTAGSRGSATLTSLQGALGESSANDTFVELFRDVGQYFVTGARDQHVVFDPHTAPIREIDAGLDRHNHSRL